MALMISKKSDEGRYGFRYFDKPIRITEQEEDEEDDLAEADQFDIPSCEVDCCDADCECDDCSRCANRYRGGDDEDIGYSDTVAAA
jgi:hypothetical protein